jgi:hypothetical protein
MGHSVADMVTNVYSHVMNEDRRNLAQKMESEFFGISDPPVETPQDDAAQKLLRLLQNSPELASTLLQMTQILSGDK